MTLIICFGLQSCKLRKLRKVYKIGRTILLSLENHTRASGYSCTRSQQERICVARLARPKRSAGGCLDGIRACQAWYPGAVVVAVVSQRSNVHSTSLSEYNNSRIELVRIARNWIWIGLSLPHYSGWAPHDGLDYGKAAACIGMSFTIVPTHGISCGQAGHRPLGTWSGALRWIARLCFPAPQKCKSMLLFRSGAAVVFWCYSCTLTILL